MTDLAGWERAVQLLGLPRETASRLGVADGEVSAVHDATGIEIARLDNIDLSEALRAAVTLAGAAVPAGARRDEVWKERFHSVAELSNIVVIQDRFLGQNLVRAFGPGGRPSGRGWSNETEWFLRCLGQSAQEGARVEVLTACAGDRPGPVTHDAKEIANAVRALGRRLVGSAGLRSLHFEISADNLYVAGGRAARFPHDRHVRFDQQVFELPSGLDRFSDFEIRHAMTCRFKQLEAKEREEEKLARSLRCIRERVI